MGEQLVARDNIFTLDALLVQHLSIEWNTLTSNMEKKDNLNSFLKTLDFASSEIKELYVTGDDYFINILKEQFDNKETLEESPTLQNFTQNNAFFRTLHNNYNFNKSYPTLSKKSTLKFFKPFDLLERADKATGLPRKWFVYFYSNIENDENKKILEVCNNRCIPAINIKEIENKFESFSELPDTIKKNQIIEPINFFKGLSKKSKFFIVYDRYIFNSFILKQENLFGFIRKKTSEPLSKDEEKINKYIDNDENETFKISEDDNYENHIEKRAFNLINHNILFFLRTMNACETDNGKCLIIGCSKGSVFYDGKKELKAYFNAIDQRINEIGNPEDPEVDSELEDLNLIKKFKNRLLIWPRKEIVDKKTKQKRKVWRKGSKTNCGHNRLIFNDHALLEYGEGRSAFVRNHYASNSWNSTGQQNISSKTLFNVKYKKRKWKKDVKNDGGYTYHQESLIDFCSDFSEDVLPKCK